LRRVLRVPVETGDTEPEHKSVQLSRVFFWLWIPALVIWKRKGGRYPGYRMEVQIIEEGAEGPSGNRRYRAWTKVSSAQHSFFCLWIPGLVVVKMKEGGYPG
jgi:hypothetical protein